MLWRLLAGGRRRVWLCRRSVRASPAGAVRAAPVPPGPAFPWRGSRAWRCWNFGMVVPTGAKSARLFLCVRPQGREGASFQSPRAPGRALPPAPALRHSLMVGAAGAGAGTALCRVLETLGLCFKFQGHELFPGKNGQIKQKTNNTHEGGGFD